MWWVVIHKIHYTSRDLQLLAKALRASHGPSVEHQHGPEGVGKGRSQGRSDTEIELDAHINIASQLDDLGKVNRLLGRFLKIGDGEDLETGVVDLGSVSAESRAMD